MVLCDKCTNGIMLKALKKGPQAKALAKTCIECEHIQLPPMKGPYLQAIKRKFPKYKTKDHFIKADCEP